MDHRATATSDRLDVPVSCQTIRFSRLPRSVFLTPEWNAGVDLSFSLGFTAFLPQYTFEVYVKIGSVTVHAADALLDFSLSDSSPRKLWCYIVIQISNDLVIETQDISIHTLPMALPQDDGSWFKCEVKPTNEYSYFSIVDIYKPQSSTKTKPILQQASFRLDEADFPDATDFGVIYRFVLRGEREQNHIRDLPDELLDQIFRAIYEHASQYMDEDEDIPASYAPGASEKAITGQIARLFNPIRSVCRQWHQVSSRYQLEPKTLEDKQRLMAKYSHCTSLWTSLHYSADDLRAGRYFQPVADCMPLLNEVRIEGFPHDEFGRTPIVHSLAAAPVLKRLAIRNITRGQKQWRYGDIVSVLATKSSLEDLSLQNVVLVPSRSQNGRAKETGETVLENSLVLVKCELSDSFANLLHLYCLNVLTIWDCWPVPFKLQTFIRNDLLPTLTHLSLRFLPFSENDLVCSQWETISMFRVIDFMTFTKLWSLKLDGGREDSNLIPVNFFEQLISSQLMNRRNFAGNLHILHIRYCETSFDSVVNFTRQFYDGGRLNEMLLETFHGQWDIQQVEELVSAYKERYLEYLGWEKTYMSFRMLEAGERLFPLKEKVVID
ncbi:hypothetical protein BT69DRAFT_748807 [Atractiella rhizophila]|nr:hypothetical protein BT69DRAFT_748807 [Atractiella rhizophila]